MDKIRVPGLKSVAVAGAFIRLDQFLKFAGAVGTGGEAKAVISGGEVAVNGAVTTERGRKLRGGDLVRFGRAVWRVKTDE